MLLDLLPVPAAIVEMHGRNLVFDAVNRPFRLAGLGTLASESPLVRLLGPRIRRFLESSEMQCEIAWQFGDEVDCRYFRVSFARRADQRAALRCMVTLIDQTAELRTEHSLRREMMTDSLTGLPNRAGFSDEVEAAIGLDNRADYAVLVVNLDRFSRVNACMGGLAGDELLISVARRLKGALRGRDILARMNGDEFGVLLKLDDGPTDALHVAKRIHAALANPFRLSDFEIRVDCSVGIALGLDSDGDPEDLVRNAQFAVKRSKKSGRTENLPHPRLRYRARAVRDGNRAAPRDRRRRDDALVPADLRSGQRPHHLVRGAGALDQRGRRQALARRVHSGRRGIGADRPARALGDGRGGADDRRVGRGGGGNCGVKVAVNLSAIQLQRDQVPTMVKAALDRHSLDGSRLTLELTESAIVTDPDRIAQTMRALKDLGTTLAMDDFGTGYSNLAYLQKLPIDLLKIDRSFVSGMLADRDKIAIVRAILSLAQALNMQTTAEGIETNELAQTLAALGCTYGQGFLYARPLEKDEAYSFLSERNG